MVEYKFYISDVDGSKLQGVYNAKKTIKVLYDLVVNQKCDETICIVEHDCDTDTDFPVYVHTGKMNDKYEKFTEGLDEKYNIKNMIKRR